MADRQVYTDCRIATMRPTDGAYGLVEDAALIVERGVITMVGAASDVPASLSVNAQSLGGRLVTPCLIDCHTHLVFGGSRAGEFEQRLRGASYAEIAAAGGGILSTVAATRTESDASLLASALGRLDALLADGVGVVEVKSGYGLSIEDECRMLRVARQLEHHRPVRVQTTWLAAHAVPAEYKGRADAYIDDIVIGGLRHAHAEGLVDAVDAFCETIGFSPAQVRRIFDAAAALGLPVKLHAEQLSDQKGACLLAGYRGLSADHLEFLDPSDARALADAGTVAVLLPGAFYFLRETQVPPVDALRRAGVPMAVATDCNPGSSPMSSLRLAMNMACTLFGLTPEEALSGVTRHAAAALGVQDRFGTIDVGKQADLVLWDVSHPAEIAYWMGGTGLAGRIRQGELT